LDARGNNAGELPFNHVKRVEDFGYTTFGPLTCGRLGSSDFPAIAFDRNNIRDKKGTALNPAGSAPATLGIISV